MGLIQIKTSHCPYSQQFEWMSSWIRLQFCSVITLRWFSFETSPKRRRRTRTRVLFTWSRWTVKSHRMNLNVEQLTIHKSNVKWLRYEKVTNFFSENLGELNATHIDDFKSFVKRIYRFLCRNSKIASNLMMMVKVFRIVLLILLHF